MHLLILKLAHLMSNNFSSLTSFL